MNSVIRLTGSDLTLEQVSLVARQGASVEIAPEAEERIRRTRNMVLAMAEDRSLPRIYGFNTGVGMNKDWDISREGLAAFNTMLIRSHSAAVGPEMDEAEVRATLLVRLNCLLADGTGVSWELVERYRDFLNLHMHPVMPGRGSIGEADLVSLDRRSRPRHPGPHGPCRHGRGRGGIPRGTHERRTRPCRGGA